MFGDDVMQQITTCTRMYVSELAWLPFGFVLDAQCLRHKPLGLRLAEEPIAALTVCLSVNMR